MLNRNPILLWPCRFAFANHAQICADLSRVLLGIVFIELITMPITQHLWTWDHFLEGGQDFELGLFVIVTCLCLVLLRAQHCRQKVRHLLTLTCVLALQFRRCLSAFQLAFARIASIAPADPPFRRRPGAFMVPLQI